MKLKAEYVEPVPPEKIAEAVAAEEEKLGEAGRGPGRRTTQGKCEKCRVRYVWPRGRMKVSKAYCPLCGDKLKATTHVLGWPVEEIRRPVLAIEAWQISKSSR